MLRSQHRACGDLLPEINHAHVSGVVCRGRVWLLCAFARYQHPQAFYDVTEGNNRCSTWSQCCDYGFYAQKGWDPVSGLGTPLYSMWKDIVLATGRHESR